MKSPDRLVDYVRSLDTFVVLMPAAASFPCVVVVGLRENSAGRPQGIEADYLRLVATGRERTPDGAWPRSPITAKALRYEGGRLVVLAADAEYRLLLDRGCPVELISCATIPDDFQRICDPELLPAYVADRPHAQTSLSLEMHVPQVRAHEPRPRSLATSGRQRPLYDRPSAAKTAAWLVIGAALIFIGARWLGLGMKQGVVVNFYGWAMIALGAVLVVRRGLDLIFPPSRL